MAQEVRVALTSTWLLVSAALLSVLMAPHLLSESTILSVSGALASPHHGQEPCLLCGMTRAFMAISRGNLAEAVTFHRWSVALYGTLLANQVMAAFFLSSRMRKRSSWHRAARGGEHNRSTHEEAPSCRCSA